MQHVTLRSLLGKRANIEIEHCHVRLVDTILSSASPDTGLSEFFFPTSVCLYGKCSKLYKYPKHGHREVPTCLSPRQVPGYWCKGLYALCWTGSAIYLFGFTVCCGDRCTFKIHLALPLLLPQPPPHTLEQDCPYRISIPLYYDRCPCSVFDIGRVLATVSRSIRAKASGHQERAGTCCIQFPLLHQHRCEQCLSAPGDGSGQFPALRTVVRPMLNVVHSFIKSFVPSPRFSLSSCRQSCSTEIWGETEYMHFSRSSLGLLLRRY